VEPVKLAEDMQQYCTQKEGDHVCALAGGGFEDIQGSYDLIINGTAASLQGIMPPISESCLAANVHCYDMMYGGRKR